MKKIIMLLAVAMAAMCVSAGQAKTVKLDPAGGKVTPTSVTVAEGEAFSELPKPTRAKAVFAGWWTAKVGGKHITSKTTFDVTDFAGQKTPTLYAHWLQFRKLTLKDVSEYAYAEWSLEEDSFEDKDMYYEIQDSLFLEYPDFVGGGYLEGKGVLEVLPGARVDVSTSDYTYDNKDNYLVFQKWAVNPSKVDMGAAFRVTAYETELTMPDADVTLQATYIDESTCGRIGVRADVSSDMPVEPPYDAFEWSPDGGKTWYKAGAGSYEDHCYGNESGSGYLDAETGEWVDVEEESALLKTGTYSMSWRSKDPNWTPASLKAKVNVSPYSEETWYPSFYYTPQVVVDVMTVEKDSWEFFSSGGTVTMNPKDGLASVHKTVTLTAKAAKNYVFQGWAYRNNGTNSWEYGERFDETGTTWKIENYIYSWSMCNGWMIDEKLLLNMFVDPDDKKVHVVAVFKALSAYSADDIVFNGFGYDSTASEDGYYCYAKAKTDGNGNASVTVKAVVGCALNDGDGYSLICGPFASPLTYKLVGKLPDGLKFDAKKGLLSGAPKKPGKMSATITATDPAKLTRSLTVNFDVSPLPEWLVGEYRYVGVEEGVGQWDPEIGDYYVPVRQNGLLELSVKSDGKVSAKINTRHGTGSVSGTLSWEPGDDEESEGVFSFYGWKNGWGCRVCFNPDEANYIPYEYLQSNDKNEGILYSQKLTGMRQDTELLAKSQFIDKYYTFAFSAMTTRADDYYGDSQQMQSGYGYLTIKTDKKGVAKVVGQLPDGEKVSVSALVMPFEEDNEIKARLYVFASPSSYKKQDWFVMALTILPDGTIKAEDGAVWTPADSAFYDYDNNYDYGYDYGYETTGTSSLTGEGALYSEAKDLENHYWNVSCDYSYNVRQQYSYDKYYYDNAYALDIDGFFFNVSVKGDKKGAISLVDKSPAPWVQDGEWNYDTDKKGNAITDPSQLSISFTKATGIFTGKASVYFDDPKPTSASLPYAGVMIYDGADGYKGFGSAVHSYKYSYTDYYGKTKTDTRKVTLPVSLNPSDGE